MKIFGTKKIKTEEKNGKRTRIRLRTHFLVECGKCKIQRWIRKGSQTLGKETYICPSCFFKKEYFCKECGVKLPKKGDFCKNHKSSNCRKCGVEIPYLKHLCDNCKKPTKKFDQRVKEYVECEYCGGSFRPFRGSSHKYCNRECVHRANKRLTPSEEAQRISCRQETVIYKKAGYLKSKECAACGSTDSLHAHHYDYNKPNSVYILCQKHHSAVHNHDLNLSEFSKTECEWNAAEIEKELKYKKTDTYKRDLLKRKRDALHRDYAILVASLFGDVSSYGELVKKSSMIKKSLGFEHKSIKEFRSRWISDRLYLSHSNTPE